MTTDEQWDGGVLDAGGRQLDQIRLTGITATGHHGVFEFERREGQTFVADVVVHLDTRRAAARDDLTHTLHYGELAEQVAAVLTGEPVDLIETVAERIAATVLAHGIVQAVDVSVHKPQAPIEVPFGDVVVRIHRDRSKLPAAEPYLAQPVADEPPPVRSSPTPTASFPVTPAPGAPVVAPTVIIAAPEVPHPTPVFAPVTSAPVTSAPATSAPAAPPTIPWDEIVPPIGQAEAVVAPAPGPMSTVGPDAAEHVADVVEEAPAPGATFVGVPGAAVTGEFVTGEIVTDALDVAPAGAVDVVLALGANLGAAQDTLRAAVEELSRTDGLQVVQVSPLARTAAVGGPEQPDYLNAIVLARTRLSPRDLLRATQAVEQAHGRERAEHWGPRTLDVDIIVYGSVLAVTDDLELPHPRAHERAFVLQPWTQVDPDAVLPGLGGGPVAALAATAPDRDGIRWLALDWLSAPPTAGEPTEQAAQPTSQQAGQYSGEHGGEAPRT